MDSDEEFAALYGAVSSGPGAPASAAAASSQPVATAIKSTTSGEGDAVHLYEPNEPQGRT